MKVIDFVNTLLPNQEKQRILESIQSTQTELTTLTIPMYERAQTLVTHQAYTSDIFKEYNKLMKNHVSGTSDNVVRDTYKALKNHNENLTKLAELIQRDTGENITIESITYRKANILQLVAAISGFARYATRMLGFLWLCETGDITLSSVTQIRQPEFLWLKSHRSDFFATLEVGLKKPKDLAKTINELPDLTVTKETAASVDAAMGKQETVVAGFTVTYSPILYLRRLWDKWTESNIDRLKKEREWLEECYNRALRDKETGQKNPAVEKRLKTWGDALSAVDQKLERLSTRPE